MRTRFLALALTALIAVGCSDQPLPTAAPTDAGSGFTPSLSIQSQFGQHDVSDQYLVLLKGKGVPSGFSDEVARLGGTVLFSHPIGFAVVNGLSDVAATTLGRNRHVNEIQQDELFDLDPMYDEASITAVTATPASSTDPTTAVVFNRQWNMRAIAADAAWASGRLGSSAVTVAILDTGIDYLHPDLAGRVDLSRSVSFVDFDDFLVGLFFPTRHLITDLNFHGTHVSSIAASNSIFFAGVTTQTTLIGVKVCDVNGSCPFSGVISGVLHAADNGADVANMSLGGSFTKAKNGRFVGFINKVFNYANSVGMTIVVSAGNAAADLDHDGNSFKTYCSAPNTICVSATGPATGGTFGPWTNVDGLASYSNFGRSAINVASPGGTGPGGGWVWGPCSQTSLVISICQTGIFALGVNGTSQAAPHVSGLASLVVEDVGRNPGQVRARIQQTADDLGQRGTDPEYGKGRINVGNAVQ